jgi:hypothetical protein
VSLDIIKLDSELFQSSLMQTDDVMDFVLRTQQKCSAPDLGFNPSQQVLRLAFGQPSLARGSVPIAVRRHWGSLFDRDEPRPMLFGLTTWKNRRRGTMNSVRRM